MKDESEHTTLVWFRDDLRVADHEALTAARADGRVVGIWIRECRDGDGLGPRPLGAAGRWWAHESLRVLSAELSDLGIPLLFAAGPAADILAEVIADLGIDSVRWSRRYAPASRDLDARIKAGLTDAGRQVHSHRGAVLVEPWTVGPQGTEHYKVFTPYYKAVLGREVGDVLPAPSAQSPFSLQWFESARSQRWARDLDGLGLRDGTGTGSGETASARTPQWWRTTVATHWSPGCQAATEELENLSRGVDGYADSHDIPADPNSTSHLSPRLRFGELSPRQLLRTAQRLTGVTGEDRHAWIRQLYWREFSWHLTFHIPGIDSDPIRPEFAHFPYEEDAEALEHWRNGTTGIPLVDAGMGQLWQTGWMHNRVRMTAASFLTKNLLTHWWHGEQWLWDTLVDADEANNPVSWQWVAGCGADAAPYFRIFNPERQRERFDPNGDYVAAWRGRGPGGDSSGSLDSDPNRSLGGEGDGSSDAGADDDAPIVDLGRSRRAALDAYDRMKGQAG